jgi:DNA-binding LytR/AlgR family response regulator
MRPLHIFIIDDEKNACDYIELLIKGLEPTAVVTKADNSIYARKLLIINDFDMVFCDIAMPVKDGLTLLKEVANVKPLPFTVIVSAYSEFAYAQTAIDINVSGYLVKPLIKDNIRRMIAKYRETACRNADLDKMMINKGNSHQLIDIDNILVIEKECRYYLNITTKTGLNCRFKDNLNSIQQQLPDHFLRINRQCIINSDEIRRFSDNWQVAHLLCRDKELSFRISRSTSNQLKHKYKHL